MAKNPGKIMLNQNNTCLRKTVPFSSFSAGQPLILGLFFPQLFVYFFVHTQSKLSKLREVDNTKI